MFSAHMTKRGQAQGGGGRAEPASLELTPFVVAVRFLQRFPLRFHRMLICHNATVWIWHRSHTQLMTRLSTGEQPGSTGHKEGDGGAGSLALCLVNKGY